MENTTKSETNALTKRKVLQSTVLMLFIFLVCRTPAAGEMFPAASAITAYMTSRSPYNLYMLIPVLAAVIPYCFSDWDVCSDFITIIVCGLFFAAAHRIKFKLWHKAVTAAAINITCTSIYRMATLTTYKTDIQTIAFEGLLVLITVFLTDAFCRSITGRQSTKNTEIQIAALAAACLLTLCGAGLSFLVWPAVIFIGLWSSAYMQTGQALYAATVAGVTAAIIQQPQWGLLMTIIIGLSVASLCKRHAMLLKGIVFVLTCAVLQSIENGEILGIDNYCLFLGTAGFLAVNWKFGKGLKKAIAIFAGNIAAEKETQEPHIISRLRECESEMSDLSDLYSTYLDKRSIFAGQFDITAQILAAAKETRIRKNKKPSLKFDMDIAVSQCAASGLINGDCCGWNRLDDDRIVMVLSDGMGKGKKAASESLMVVKTIMSLLRCGVNTDMTLKTVNTIMMMKDDEDSFATVDLIIADKRTGRARLYKIGAAPTLIRHKDRVEEVKLAAVPLGIVNGLKIRYVETEIKKGDWIIMMSDGISDGGTGLGIMDCIKETAANVRSTDPQTMCDLILNRASDSYIGKERDDLTVMAARII